MAGSRKRSKNDAPEAVIVTDRPAGRRRAAKKKSRLPLVAAGVTALVIASGASVYAHQANQEPELPVLPSAAAMASYGVTDADLCEKFGEIKCSVNRVQSDQPVGTLLKETPAAGKRSLKVALTYSSGPATVKAPILAGTSKATADEYLWGLGLKLGAVTEASSSAPAGTIVSSSVAPATEVANGTLIAVTTSTGRVKVPDWTGKTREFIQADANRLGLTVAFTEKKSNKSPVGVALSQSAKAVEVQAQTPVTVVLSKFVSSEKVAVPTVVGQDENTAISLLAASGFLKIKTVATPSNAKTSKVTKISPAEGKEISPGREITLYVTRAKQ